MDYFKSPPHILQIAKLLLMHQGYIGKKSHHDCTGPYVVKTILDPGLY